MEMRQIKSLIEHKNSELKLIIVGEKLNKISRKMTFLVRIKNRNSERSKLDEAAPSMGIK